MLRPGEDDHFINEAIAVSMFVQPVCLTLGCLWMFPSRSHTFQTNSLDLVALADIRAGDEICISYIDPGLKVR